VERLDRNMRRQIRMAQRAALWLRSIGPVYWRMLSIRCSAPCAAAGTPVFGRPFLDRVLCGLKDRFNIAVARRASELVGLCPARGGARGVRVWGGTLASTGICARLLIYWELLRDAAERGCQFLDMGRSPAGSPASGFKASGAGLASLCISNRWRWSGTQAAMPGGILASLPCVFDGWPHDAAVASSAAGSGILAGAASSAPRAFR